MIENLSKVDYTRRLFREGKAAISAKMAGIIDRLGSRAENWQARMEKLRIGTAHFGSQPFRLYSEVTPGAEVVYGPIVPTRCRNREKGTPQW